MNSTLNKELIKVGTRGSRLALLQVDEIQSLLEENVGNADLRSLPSFECIIHKTAGDQDKKTPLTQNLADDFFTDTLDRALLNHKIDIAIHSAKDLPEQLAEGLSIFALTASLDDTDAFVGKVRFNDLKPGAKVGTSSLIRQNAVKKLNPQIEVVDIRGTIEERIQLIEDGHCEGVIIATVALKRLGLEQHIKDIMPWEAMPLQGQLAVVGRTDDMKLRDVFSSIDIRKTYGRVLLVGAGPGDPELITYKGIKALKEADSVFYDYLIPKELLEHAGKAEKIYAGKRKGARTLPQEELSKMIRQKAMEGKTVVRLKGGDPLIFGRGADEIEYLRAYHIKVEVVAGVSSATAIPSSLGIPLTARGISSSVAFLSGHAEEEQASDANLIEIPHVKTIVFLMGLTKIDVIIKSLRAACWAEDVPVIVISKGTSADEKIVSGTISNIRGRIQEQKLDPPALIIAGPTVKFFNPELRGIHTDAPEVPHSQTNILYTGTNPEKFQSLGRIVHFPMIEVTEPSLTQQQIQALADQMGHYHIILFTSRFAVKHFFEILKKNDFPISDLKVKDFLVIGNDTAAALMKHHFQPALVAKVETSRGLIDDIKQHFDVKGKRILFPRSSLPNPYLKEELTKLGGRVEEFAVYQNIKPEKRQLPEDPIDKILFTSPSTVKNFLQDYAAIPNTWGILSKGPLTSKSLEEAGYESEVVIYD